MLVVAPPANQKAHQESNRMRKDGKRTTAEKTQKQNNTRVRSGDGPLWPPRIPTKEQKQAPPNRSSNIESDRGALGEVSPEVFKTRSLVKPSTIQAQKEKRAKTNHAETNPQNKLIPKPDIEPPQKVSRNCNESSPRLHL